MIGHNLVAFLIERRNPVIDTSAPAPLSGLRHFE
jgi:hypothetical protein